MSCAYPMWRIPEDALLNHPLYHAYKGRLYHSGVIIQRPEFNSIKACYPVLAERIDQIPCGKCIECRLSYSRDWANRCMLELKTSLNAYFITLTYSDKNLHFSPYVDPDTGEVSLSPMLWPADLRNFIKRLRFWAHDSGLRQRFFACGEYGETSSRPHYHLIVYNLPSEFEKNKHKFQDDPILWTCDALDDLWPHGMAVYGDVNWETCAYVARYVVKKRKGKDRQKQIEMQEQLFPDSPWIDEFVRMSRMPGLARDYYEQKKHSIYATDEMFVNVKGSVNAVRPCKYYDRLYDVECPEHLDELKKRRKYVTEQMKLDELSQVGLREEVYLEQKAESKRLQAAKLVRPSI